MSFYYLKDGKSCGPVDLDELSQMAQSGRLLPDDLVTRAGEPAWTAARALSLPFALASSPPSLPPAPVPPAANAADLPPPLPQGTPAPVSFQAAAPAAASVVQAKVDQLTSRAGPALNRFIDAAARLTGLDRIKVIPILIGVGFSLLVLFSTLLVWWSGGQTMKLPGVDTLGEHYQYRGISYIDGKLIFTVLVGALVAVAMGALRRTWLAPALLAAAAAATLSTVVMFGLRHNLNVAAAEAIAAVEQNRGMFEKISPDMVKAMDQQFYATVGWGLTLGVLCALAAAAAFSVSCVLVPQRLTMFADKGPFIERNLALIGSQLLAFLAGLIVVVIRY